MGDIGFIFGYAVLGAFCIGTLVGYWIRGIGDKKDDGGNRGSTDPE